MVVDPTSLARPRDSNAPPPLRLLGGLIFQCNELECRSQCRAECRRFLHEILLEGCGKGLSLSKLYFCSVRQRLDYQLLVNSVNATFGLDNLVNFSSFIRDRQHLQLRQTNIHRRYRNTRFPPSKPNPLCRGALIAFTFRKVTF